MVRARKLNNKITIQTPTETRDSYGDPVKSWATYAVRSASITPVNGNEVFVAQQVYSEQVSRFRLRYDSVTKDITTKMRILYDSRYFNIISVINEYTENKEITLVCSEVV